MISSCKQRSPAYVCQVLPLGTAHQRDPQLMIVSFLSYAARFCCGRYRPLQLCSHSSGRPTRRSPGLQVASAGCAKRKQSARPLGEGVLDLIWPCRPTPRRSLCWVRGSRRAQSVLAPKTLPRRSKTRSRSF